jgi:stage V sporulation protein G
MKITKVEILKIKTTNRVKGLATITIDECFVVHNIKILEGEKELFIAMPSKRTENGEIKDIAHPINAETRKMIQDKILEEYNK